MDAGLVCGLHFEKSFQLTLVLDECMELIDKNSLVQ